MYITFFSYIHILQLCLPRKSVSSSILASHTVSLLCQVHALFNGLSSLPLVFFAEKKRAMAREGQRRTARERERERERGRQAGRQAGRPAGRQTDRQTDRPTERGEGRKEGCEDVAGVDAKGLTHLLRLIRNFIHLSILLDRSQMNVLIDGALDTTKTLIHGRARVGV